jgi:hypothetical protein
LYKSKFFPLKIATWNQWLFFNGGTQGNQMFLDMFLECGGYVELPRLGVYFEILLGVGLLSIVLVINVLGFLIFLDGLVVGKLCAINLFLHEGDSIGICERGTKDGYCFFH